MTIPAQLNYSGPNKEFQFRDVFIMPLLIRLGFGVVANNHGQREFGRDVVFGDVDRFGHVVYYGMQIKYESSISLSGSHSIAQDAEQATNNPFKHPHSGREEYISCFYVANAGDISDAARENFFSTIARRGIRDAKLLDGNALLLLDRAASLNRNAQLQERLTGLLQEIRINRILMPNVVAALRAYAEDANTNPFPMQRFRNTATGNYLNAPFFIHGLPIDVVDQYWQIIRMLNDTADSVDGPISAGDFRKHRVEGFATLAQQSVAHGMQLEKAVVALLNQLNGTGAM
jgi:hypothetical protein